MPFIVREVELEDFISHEKTLLRLGPGITVFIGENGAGKSSIVDAIYYALVLPSRQAVRGGKANLVRRGSKRGRARVRLVLEDTRTGRELEVHAEIDGRQNRSSVEVYLRTPEDRSRGRRGKLIARKYEAARQEIPRALGMDPESFDDIVPRVVVLRQGMLAQTISLFASGKARDKREFLSRLFGLESYRRAAEKIRELEVEVEGAKVRSTAEKILRDLLDKKLEELAGKEKKRSRLAEEVRSLRPRLEEAENRLRERESIVQQYQDLLDEAKRALSAIEGTLNESRKALQEKLRAKKSFEELGCPGVEERKRALAERVSRLERLADELAGLEARLAQARSALLEAERRAGEAIEKYEAVKNAIELFHGRHPRLVLDETSRLAKMLADLKGEKAELVRRKNDLARAIRAARKWARKISEILGEELEPDEALEKARRALEDLKREADELRRRAESLVAEAAKLASRADDLEEKARILMGAKGRCPVCGRELPREEARGLAASMLAEARKLRASAEAARRKAEEEKKRADDLERLAESLRTWLSRLERELEALESEYGGYKKALEELDRVSRRLEDVLESIRRLEQRLNELESLKGDAIKLAGALSKYGIDSDELGEDLLRSLEEEARRAVSSLEEARRGVEQLEKNVERLLEEASGLVGVRVENAGDAREALEGMRRDLETLEKRAVECSRLQGELRGLAELEARVRELEQEKRSSEERVRRIEKELDSARTELERAESTVEQIKKELTSKEALLKGLEEELERLRGEVRGLQRQLWASRVLATTRLVLERAPEVLYQRKLALLEEMASRVLASFNTKYVEIRTVRDGDDLRFILASREGTSADLAMLSGGEQTAFGLALVIGLNKLLAGDIGFLVLDEPTAHLDQDKRRLIAEILRELKSEAQGVVDQIIIVSHEPQLIDAADAVYRVSYENGRSVVREELPEGLPM